MTDEAELGAWAAEWLGTPCAAGNNWCGHADLDHDGRVDMTDFSIFASLWLEEL